MADPLNPGPVERFFRRLYSGYCLVLKTAAWLIVAAVVIVVIVGIWQAAQPKPWCTDPTTGRKAFCNDPNFRHRLDKWERDQGW